MKKLLLLNLVLSGLLITVLSFGQRVTPQKNGSKFSLQVANVYFEVDSAYGGRITSLKLNNKQILWVSNSIADMWGSTFWPSPQSYWNWPPTPSFDTQPYHGGIKGDSISIVSDVDNTSGARNTKLKLRKTFYADLSDTSITINYYMINTGTTAKSFAPWEITRVPVGKGFAFFPDSGTSSGLLLPYFDAINNLLWFDYAGTLPTNSTYKLISNSKEGWTAWANTDSVVFVKKFKNIQTSDAAPSENEVEYYMQGPTTYYEIENQGAYKSIAVGDSLKWSMKWYARQIPATVDPKKGSTGLANYVRSVVAQKVISGVKELAKTQIKVYSTSDNLLKVEGLTQKANLTVVDLSGKVVIQASLNPGSISVSMNKFSSGLYLYRIRSLEINYTGKLIIRK